MGRVYVLSALGGGRSTDARASIEKINGVPVHEVTRALLERTNGDTAALRAVILSARWWWFYWKVFGAPATFEIELKLPSGTSISRVPASKQMPSWIQENNALDFDKAFRFWQINKETSVLTVNTFD